MSGLQVVQGPHVVQPVGKLDHQHPDVAAHRHDHLADGFGLGGLAVLDLLQLGAAVDEQRNLFAELMGQLGERVVGVLDRVVQQRRTQRCLGHAELGEDGSHRERMGDECIPALPRLAGMQSLGRTVRALDQSEVGFGVIGADDAKERIERRCLGPAGA